MRQVWTFAEIIVICDLFFQMTGVSLIFRHLFEDEDEFIAYTARGVGTGHSKSGQRKKWTRRYYFERDLLAQESQQLEPITFSNKYAGCSVEDIALIWQKIHLNVVRPRETEVHARNKLLLWLDKIHNDLSWNQVSKSYQIGVATAIQYVNEDLLPGIITAYQGSKIISFQNPQQRLTMVEMNKQRGISMAHALYTMDGKHVRCKGAHIKERGSHKHNFKPCFNCLFVIERTFGTVCAYNLDEHATKHDLTMLRESSWFQNLILLTDGWIIMADKGYEGVNFPTIAPTFKKSNKRKKQWPREFWWKLQSARGDSERVFAHFFVNKYKQLSNWHGKGSNAFKKWALNMTCAIIIYNHLKLHNVKVC